MRTDNPPPGSENRSPDTARWQLQPVGMRSRVWLALLTFALPVILSIVLPLFDHRPTATARWIHETLRAQQSAEQWFGPILVAALAAAIWLVLDRLLLRHALQIDQAGLDIKTTLYRRRIRWADLDLAAARVIDLDEHPERKPLLKSNGLSLPGFNSGWFRSRAFAKLFVATAGGSRLLWLPTRLGYTLLLQPVSPVALLDRLREASPGSVDAAITPARRLR
jgi:hypothetical protein